MTRRAVIAFDCLFPNQTGGGERVYRRIADELADQGWDVEYLTRDLHSADAVRFRVTSIWQGEIYDQRGTRLVTSAPKFAFALYHALRRRRDIDLFLISATPVLNIFAVRAALLGRASKKVIVDWLEIWPARKWRKYSGWVVGSAAYFAQFIGLCLTTNVTVNSDETLRRLPFKRLRASSVKLALHSAHSPVAHTARLRSSQDIKLLFVGRLIPDKRADTLVPALKVLRERYPQSMLTVVGEGPERKVLEKQIGDFELEDSVRLLGRVSDEELQELYKQSTVLVNPSVREGFGLVVVEAAELGTPSVLIPGSENAAADLIQEGENGFLSIDHSPVALAEAISKVVAGGSKLRSLTAKWSQRTQTLKPFEESVREIISLVDV